MAHVAKRPRLHGPKNPTLTLPATAPKLRNLQVEHENSLRQSAQRLKTSWEDICRRYGRDFEGEGDEIDLRTGEVVIDNGHLRGLEEDLEDTWGGGDDDEEGDDAGSPTSSLEMELLARRPMLARDEMGGPMLRDDEAEEIDVDEDLDRDAIDDLFDELELATGFTGKEKRRREKDQKMQEAQGSVQKEQIGQDSIPSPASSEQAEEDDDKEEASTVHPIMKEAGMDVGTAASPDELPPDDVMLEYVTKLGRQRLLALVQTLQSTEEPVDMEDPAIVAQLTPISDCGKPLSEQLGEAVEKLAASKEPVPEPIDKEEDEPEQVSEGKQNGGAGLELRRDSEPPAALELPAEAVQRAEDAPDCGAEAIPPTPSETAIDKNLANAAQSTEVITRGISTLVERDFIDTDLEPALEPETEPKPEPEPEPAPVQPTNDQVQPEEELPTELVSDLNPAVEPERSEEGQPPTIVNQEPDPNFHYGDIDDLSTIIVPKTLVPVTPKNRLYSTKSSSSLRKAMSSRRQGRRRLSELETPKMARISLSSKRRVPQTVPSKLRSAASHGPSGTSPPKSAGPRNFWSALPGDPFYDPQWQDSHPDGEPGFEEFERRRILLEEHAVNRVKPKKRANDDLMILDSTPVRKKKSSKANSQVTPKTKEPKTPTSKRAKHEDEVERRLRTLRSGKFLEYIKKKAAKERDSAKREIAAEGTSDPLTGPIDAEPSTPTRRMKYGLSDNEEDVLPIESQDLQISSAPVQKKTRGRPRKAPVPLIAPDQPVPSPRRLRSQGSSTGDPLAKCGDTGYRCEKALCFKCIDE
ncbi:uncharacterized protein DFL_007223 [Arthrobotrys flagrans]|uniref:Uncharacterized protein n=1 Tax=Arthrobotrys flagrans TaxID=97331 RepID=A0A436ZVE5_ARTFL|nr:hypothetical protein DFL_007223 [Arthrobotrys flagrans]